MTPERKEKLAEALAKAEELERRIYSGQLIADRLAAEGAAGINIDVEFLRRDEVAHLLSIERYSAEVERLRGLVSDELSRFVSTVVDELRSEYAALDV